MWLLFDFHENTNQRQHTKVHPPMLDGEASGVFATRCAGGFDISTFKTALPRRFQCREENSAEMRHKRPYKQSTGRTPHRPNSIGLSLAMLDSVDLGRGTENAFAPFYLKSIPDELRLHRPRSLAWHRCD